MQCYLRPSKISGSRCALFRPKAQKAPCHTAARHRRRRAEPTTSPQGAPNSGGEARAPVSEQCSRALRTQWSSCNISCLSLLICRLCRRRIPRANASARSPTPLGHDADNRHMRPGASETSPSRSGLLLPLLARRRWSAPRAAARYHRRGASITEPDKPPAAAPVPAPTRRHDRRKKRTGGGYIKPKRTSGEVKR